MRTKAESAVDSFPATKQGWATLPSATSGLGRKGKQGEGLISRPQTVLSLILTTCPESSSRTRTKQGSPPKIHT